MQNSIYFWNAKNYNIIIIVKYVTFHPNEKQQIKL